MSPTAHRVLALASLGCGVDGAYGESVWLLSFTAHGHLHLWEGQEHRGRLITSVDVLQHARERAVSFVGLSSAHLQVSPCQTLACLVLSSTVFVVSLPSRRSTGASLTVQFVMFNVVVPHQCSSEIVSFFVVGNRVRWQP